MSAIETIGTIPAKRAVVLWNDGGERDQATTAVRVCLYEDVARTERRVGRMENSRGACDFDWMRGAHWMACPMGIFTWIATVEGFAGRQVKIAALWEFAKIEGQAWAVDQLRELGETVDP